MNDYICTVVEQEKMKIQHGMTTERGRWKTPRDRANINFFPGRLPYLKRTKPKCCTLESIETSNTRSREKIIILYMYL